MSQQRPTLRDIAKITGFHFTTVGLALRGSSQLSQETVRIVREAADKVGYRPSPLLSALSAFRTHPHRQLTGIIGFLCTYDNPRVVETNRRAYRLFSAASALADKRGFKLEAIQIDLAKSRPARVAGLLQARGIHAVILAPLVPKAGPFIDLPWEKFSVVGVGYSITNLRPHRVCFSHFQGMLMHLRKLRERGYKRIGFYVSHEVNVRTGGNLLGAFFAEQRLQPDSSWIEPMLTVDTEAERSRFLRWLKKEKPDCLIAAGRRATEWLEKEGIQAPDDIGLSLASRIDESTPVAGIDEQDENLGEAAVDLAISLLRGDERGLPQYPRHIMVDPRWVYKPTVRALADDDVVAEAR